MEASGLFDQCLIILEGRQDVNVNQQLHEMLALCCAEGTRGTGQGFGSLFAQVDYICRRLRLSDGDRLALQTLRRHSNQREPLTADDLRYDVRALSLLISAVFAVPIPPRLVKLIPAANRPPLHAGHTDISYVRCIVSSWDSQYVYADSDHGSLRIALDEEKEGYLRQLLCRGMQLNLLDSEMQGAVIVPGLTVVEPDYLMDISALAACFATPEHHPLAYTVNRMKPRQNTQAILLGNFAGRALDDIINQQDFQLNRTLVKNFREQLLPFCACDGFDGKKFVDDARRQVGNLQLSVEMLLQEHDRSRVILEPSFVCERLGLQGRVDLMTTDMRLLVEQKSGRNMRIERQAAIVHREDHYVQLLLYYGVLRYNFGLRIGQTDMRLLYSKYAPSEGLLVVNYYGKLFREAIRQRNLIVAWEYYMAREGFDKVLTGVWPSDLPLTPVEAAYLTQMMTFVYREQLRQKTGGRKGYGNAVSDLWNMPLAEKQDTGNIYMGLKLAERSRRSPHSGYDLLTLTLSEGEEAGESNFRRGDSVYLYAYQDVPDVRRSLLFKGTLEEVGTRRLVVRLNDGQQNPDVLQGETWAVEHAGGDGSSSSIRGLYQLMAAPADRKALLLGQRKPRADHNISLSRSYHADYDGVLLRARQALDYFLLVGPPGTGKTSMALRFLVEEELSAGSDVLLTAYTNRAVDEICAMLDGAGLDFLRLGYETSCAPRYRRYLLENKLGGGVTLDDAKTHIRQTRIVVGTTSMLQVQPFIFTLKHFSVVIIDEASQILEPSIVGLLAQDIDRFILIGDCKQLPAVVQQTEEETCVDHPLLNAVGITNCAHSLFERLLRWERMEGRAEFTGILRRQGRMHPDVAAFANRMFYVQEKLEPVPLPHQLDTSLHYEEASQDELDDLLKQERVMFFPANMVAEEAVLVSSLLQRVYRFYGAAFDAAKTVGVIVPYRSQIALIRHQLEQLNIPQLLDISIDTVERFQGSQRDVIIYSFSVSYDYQLDFLTSSCYEDDGRTIDRRLNVALTRARKQMLMTGNEKILKKNKIFSELIALYRKNIVSLYPSNEWRNDTITAS